MTDTEKIAFSFFPLERQSFEFTVYRRLYQQGETKSDFSNSSRRKLPEKPLNEDKVPYTSYWVSFEPREGFTSYRCEPHTNIYLTYEYLYRQLLQSSETNLTRDDYSTGDRFRDYWINFIIARFPQGNQVVSMEPYLLKTIGEFGFLADFHFKKDREVPFSSEIQKLSLSLDKNGRSNRDSYTDRYSKIQEFLTIYGPRILTLPSGVSISRSFYKFDAEQLGTKQYVFAQGKQASSQFKGVKVHSPLQQIDNNTKVYFLYRQQDKPFSHDLYRALRGDTYSYQFPGMEPMFGYKFDGTNVGGSAISDFSSDSINRVIDAILADAAGRPVVPLVIVPFDKFSDKDQAPYYYAKHAFLERGIPSQFVSLRLLRQKNQLKWAVSNIGLGLFAKMGGQPWKVNPETDNCLIIGIGQSHNRTTGGRIDKYFAYSVLTESTGLYKELRILGETTDSGTYYDSFRKNLKSAIEQYHGEYDTFVVHTTFKVRREELKAVKDVIKSVQAANSNSPKRFVVIKFNDKNKFFGYSPSHNSMVPYESSYIPLSHTEYLVWFEGLQYHNPNIYQRVQRPVHIEFIFESPELMTENRIAYLQDALNISGANWRGFNAKSLPISVLYAYLVAEFYKEFQKLGLQSPDFETLSPWFL